MGPCLDIQTEVKHYFHRTTIHNRRFYMTQLIHLDGNSQHSKRSHRCSSARCPMWDDEQAKEAVIASRKIVDDIVREKTSRLGVTTGFVPCNVSISPEDTVQLQENLIRTLIWLRDPLPKMPFVPSCWSVSITLKGYSGIRLSTVENC